jgi:hypothetical protein
MTQLEIERNLQVFDRLAPDSVGDRRNLVARHIEYYEKLERGLRHCFCRFVILVEEPDLQPKSHQCLSRLVRVPIVDGFADRIGQECPNAEFYLRPRLVIVVDSRRGRATPQSGTWKALYQTMHELGIRRVYFVGSYRASRIFSATHTVHGKKAR